MRDYLTELLRKGLFSEDESIRRISLLDALFGFVAGLVVGTQLFLGLFR